MRVCEINTAFQSQFSFFYLRAIVIEVERFFGIGSVKQPDVWRTAKVNIVVEKRIWELRQGCSNVTLHVGFQGNLFFFFLIRKKVRKKRKKMDRGQQPTG